MDRFLITGLGNPGKLYQKTRHNLGFFILDQISEKYFFSFSQKKLGSLSEFIFQEKQIFFLKPSTYVNESGLSVKYWMNKKKILLKNILIISDDIYLNFGNIRLRGKGGDGGHNGLKSIEKELKSSHYARLRFGIKNDFSKKINYVLGIWNKNELKNILNRLEISINVIFSFTLNGLQKTMNLFNKKNLE
ncbi:aminoacyl-tRNA hydrolase [Blattabacterium sp. (Cryptocercus kyebangensis)]|uniref:aminoacyl-tRNA hydrolase n=1 Tax=Blattabacterium sp. (Cryptocercus kyebangensis) TaxID=298656 RepID=UPI000D7C3678|nr:aminoacyl-tRNA hydrolase [Blattabacterium sp. (Cryptocercus kyebangensis)]AWU43516.1 aminoacyl-tRNA hydrolase [Blattabacterium sp. (Cryptocercus kyebangensis)]